MVYRNAISKIFALPSALEFALLDEVSVAIFLVTLLEISLLLINEPICSESITQAKLNVLVCEETHNT